MTEKRRTWLMAIVYIITIIAVALGVFAIYNLVTKEKPWTIGVTYADRLTYSADNKQIVNLKIHNNANGNGASLYDMQFTSYTDADGKGVKSFGIQAVGDWLICNKNFGILEYSNEELYNANKSAVDNTLKTLVIGDFYYYHTGDNGITYSKLNMSQQMDDFLLIDINGEFFKLTLKDNSVYEKYTTKDYFFDWSLWGKDGFWITKKATWLDVFAYFMSSAMTSSGQEEYSTFPLNFMNCGNLLTIEQKVNGKYEKLEDTSVSKNYLTASVEYSKDGAIDVTDSIFKQVAYSTTWNYFNNTTVVDYWGVSDVKELTEAQLNYEYDTLTDKYTLTINKEFADCLTELGNEVIVNMDLTKTKHPVVAIDLTNFYFNIKSFTINNATSDFEIINQDACKIVPEIKEA